jgi:hypothetical protein
LVIAKARMAFSVWALNIAAYRVPHPACAGALGAMPGQPVVENGFQLDSLVATINDEVVCGKREAGHADQHRDQSRHLQN